jgi:hypothetical protein
LIVRQWWKTYDLLIAHHTVLLLLLVYVAWRWLA